jgi:hypothetical protein
VFVFSPATSALLESGQLLVTGALAGLCWTVQLAVYRLFPVQLAEGGAAAFRTYHAAYVRAMAWVAAPLMIVELGLAVAWAGRAEAGAADLGGLGLVGAIWALTFVCIVPVHERLQAAPTLELMRCLLRLNALRTALWAIRAGWLLWSVRGE